MEEKNGGYDLEGVIWHQHSNRLLIEIMKHFSKDVPVLDIGCGHNFYVSILEYSGYKACGYDLVDLGSNHFIKKDISKEEAFGDIPINRNIISLEVGEHIPLELAHNYLNNITHFEGHIIMSWAIPGQAGIGHINCQSNEWVIQQMLSRGYKLDLEKTLSLRRAVTDCHCTWFYTTLMYFIPCE